MSEFKFLRKSAFNVAFGFFIGKEAARFVDCVLTSIFKHVIDDVCDKKISKEEKEVEE